MGQYVFLLYFHFWKASLRSLFPEQGGFCMCVHVRVRVGVCAYVQRLMCVRACVRTYKCLFFMYAYVHRSVRASP